MKRAINLLIIVLITSCTQPKEYNPAPDSYVIKNKLKGPVRIVEKTITDKKYNSISSEKITFNEYGNITEQVEISSDGKKNKTVNNYDNLGRLVESSEFVGEMIKNKEIINYFDSNKDFLKLIIRCSKYPNENDTIYYLKTKQGSELYKFINGEKRTRKIEKINIVDGKKIIKKWNYSGYIYYDSSINGSQKFRPEPQSYEEIHYDSENNLIYNENRNGINIHSGVPKKVTIRQVILDNKKNVTQRSSIESEYLQRDQYSNDRTKFEQSSEEQINANWYKKIIELIQEYNYDYDFQGNVRKKVQVNSKARYGGDLFQYTSYKDKTLNEVFIKSHNKWMGYTSGAYETKYNYKDELLVEIIEYNRNGEIRSKTLYDNNGNQINWWHFLKNQTLSTSNEYNNQNQLIKTYSNNVLIREYIYDENGNIIENNFYTDGEYISEKKVSKIVVDKYNNAVNEKYYLNDELTDEIITSYQYGDF